MPRNPRETFFITCAPGVEPVLHREARELRLGRVERQVGGVRFEGTMRDAWRANLWLRTGIRVLRRLAVFPAPGESQLYDGVRAIDWSRYLAADGSLIVAAQTRRSNLDHSLFLAQVTKDAICDQFVDREGRRPNVEKESPDLALHVHLSQDRCTLSIDTSGASLHKRGWRRFQGQAPLSETLAATVVLLSGWDRRSPLVDPFCGSGTLLIEAALIAGNIAPGIFREQFAFERLPDHDARGWQRLRDEAKREERWPAKLIVRGSDVDPRVVVGARDNLAGAGLAEQIDIEVGDARALDLRRGWNAWIITNPPYGERVGESGELVGLYRSFGELLRERCAGYRLALLSGNPRLASELGVQPEIRTRLLNGAIECELLRGEIGE